MLQSRRPDWAALFRIVRLPAAGGLLLALAFPPLRLWPLAFVAWVPLWLALRSDSPLGAGPWRKPAPREAGAFGADREAKLSREGRGHRASGPEGEAAAGRFSWRVTFLRGWAMGFVAFVAMLYWILGLSNEEVTIPGLMIPALALIGLYLGLFFGAAALSLRWLSRITGAPLLLLAPPVTLFFEWLRGQGPLAFPWGAPAYALARVTPLLQAASVTGFWGLVLLMLGLNALFAAFLAGRRIALPAAFGLLAIGWWSGHATLARHPDGRIEEGRQALRVLVAQPDIRREIKWKPEHRKEVIDAVMDHAYESAAQAQATGGFDLFVWPETVFPIVVQRDPSLLSRVQAFVDSIARPTLVGTQELEWYRDRPGKKYAFFNSAVLMEPGGRVSPPYRKMRLVPFSERMPLQEIAPWLNGIDFGQSDFSAGKEPVLFTVGGACAGCLICFESVFPELSAEMVRRGATLLVNITNDFWFGRTAGPIQHADMAILRAVENRVPLVRCANTGVSFVVDPWGRVREERGMFTQAAFVARVACGSGSFAASHPLWIAWPWLAWILAACAAGLGMRARYSRRRTIASAVDASSNDPAWTAGGRELRPEPDREGAQWRPR